MMSPNVSSTDLSSVSDFKVGNLNGKWDGTALSENAQKFAGKIAADYETSTKTEILKDSRREINTDTYQKDKGSELFTTPLGPARPVGSGAFTALRVYRGIVLSRKVDTFLARLVDPQGEEPGIEAEISISEIQKFDRDLVQEGAAFYWTIGFWDSLGGLKSRISQIRFRRFPEWDTSKLEKAIANAKSLGELFK